MLRELGGHTHQVVTGVCLKSGGRTAVFHDVTAVHFKALSTSTIEAYVAAVPVLDKAGAYAIQDRGEMLVEGIVGSYSNVVGLPLERLAQEFDAWGIPYSRRSR